MHPGLTKAAAIILKLASLAFIVAAVYHLAAVFFDLNKSSVLRNLLFVIINIWCAMEIGRGRKYFIFLFTILFIQQLISHGSWVVNGESAQGRVLDIFVLMSITIIYAALLIRKSDRSGNPVRTEYDAQ
jgi:hypothetical protein